MQACDKTICDIANSLKPRSYTSREFIKEMGKYLKENAKRGDSLIEIHMTTMFQFLPSFHDSSAGFGLVMHQEENPDKHITID